MEHETDSQIGEVSKVKWVLYQTVIVRKELSLRVNLSIYNLIYVLTITHGHDLWVVTERMRMQ